MNFIVGKDYKTRGGWKAKCVFIKKSGMAFFAHFMEREEEINSHHENGRMYCERHINPKDIISEWVGPEPAVIVDGWVDIYKDGIREGSDTFIAPYCIDCLHLRYDSSQPLEKRIVVVTGEV